PQAPNNLCIWNKLFWWDQLPFLKYVPVVISPIVRQHIVLPFSLIKVYFNQNIKTIVISLELS
ncbi:hypothetical protein, partial [Bartonella sp. CB178]|uniref:hypothetical protein n=1 Tax=Bartonella sp. CB178 TaxID=3112255 RepID=UPI00300DEA32